MPPIAQLIQVMAFFLVSPRVIGIKSCQLAQCFQRLPVPAAIALCDGLDIKRFGIGWIVIELLLDEFNGLLELATL